MKLRDTNSPEGWAATTYRGIQDDREIYLAVALFGNKVRVGASYDSEDDALSELDAMYEERIAVLGAPSSDCAVLEEEIRRLEDLVSALEDEIDLLPSEWDIDELSSTIEDLEADKADLQDELATAEEDFSHALDQIDDLQFEVDQLRALPLF